MPGHEWRSLSWLHEGAALTVQRPLFALWSDPITVAAGVEYRSESARQTTSANTAEIVDYTGVRGGPAGLAGRVGPCIVGNPQPLAGSFDIKEGFVELPAPLARNPPLVDLLAVTPTSHPPVPRNNG